MNPKPLTIRVNTLKTNDSVIEKEFRSLKAPLLKEKKIEHCYYVDPNFSDKKFRSTSVYKDGLVYAQNLSSQIPPVILAPQKNERILDLCASPGSKTSQIAALMQNQGELTALEPDHIRCERLSHNLNLLGATATVYNYHAERYTNKHLGESLPLFDRVLADVPCSGDGTFYVNSKASFAHWKEADLMKRHKQQIKILKAGLSVLKNSGVLVYSTCSISPEENELVLDSILKDTPGIELVDIRSQISPALSSLFQAPLLQWQNEKLNVEISKACRIFPSHNTEGFFVALFKKL